MATRTNNENVLGKLVRYGYPRDKELIKEEASTSYDKAIMNHPELQKEYHDLIEERKKVSHTSKRYCI